MKENTLHIKQLNQTLDLLAVHHINPTRYPFLLESVAKNKTIGRYDILFAFPQASLWLDAEGQVHTSNVELNTDSVFSAFEQWFFEQGFSEQGFFEQGFKAEQTDIQTDLPFLGGWFVFLAYEFAEQVEPVLHLPKDTDNVLPQAYFARIPAAIIVDHQAKKTFIIAEANHQALVSAIENDIQNSVTLPEPQHDPQHDIAIEIIEEASQQYIDGVKKIKQYIIDGDIFQVNLSRLWSIELSAQQTPDSLYRQLRHTNPAPFAGLACFADAAIISSSPERLVKVKNGIVETRPIAGTRPRQRDASGELDIQANKMLQNELIAHPKERAEHIMLIDLERNDMGRICLQGSIVVDELMVLESYQHVHHIVSNIRGQLRPNCSPVEVIKAVFPGGTITGCPKVRCMEIIAELEQQARMAYTGSMGYINRNGDMDLNILIRTIIQQDRRLFIRAGAGIVADSDPEKELQETRHKAKGMLNAL